MKRLNYNQLFYFYVVATEGSIKEACKKLHLTQPTISGQLKTLEDSLGYQLFTRKYRKLVLNEQGHQILKKAEKIFLLGDDLLSSVLGEPKKSKNDLRIGVVPSLPNALVHDFTLGIWKGRNIFGELVHGRMSELMDQLDEDRIDLLLSDAPSERPGKYSSLNIGEQKLVVVGNDKFLSAKQDFPKSLSGLPFVGFSGNGQIQDEINFVFKMRNIEPDRIGTVDDEDCLRKLTVEGYCFSVLPEISVKGQLDDGVLFKLGDMFDVVSNCWVVTSKFGSNRVLVKEMITDYLHRREDMASVLKEAS